MRQTLHTLENTDCAPLALTIGNFDGVHIGHQAMIDCLVKNAQIHHLRPAAMTFSPHAKVLFGHCDNYLISSDEEKSQVLCQHGIEQLYQIPFNHAFSRLSAETFLNKLRQLPVKYLLVGEDFRFGYQGKGNWDYLVKYGKQHGIIIEQMPTVNFHSERVSSSRIRDHIRHASSHDDFLHIAELLGRPLSYSGLVKRGKQLGKTIGFPTANIYIPKTRLLPTGVFVVSVNVQNKNYWGMCNIGTNPTIDDDIPRRIEVHLLSFDGDLYDKKICVQPLVKLREEQRFNGVAELINQLEKDKQNSLAIIEKIKSHTE